MSTWIDYTLDVLAGSPTEINLIAERLKQPSTELVNWASARFGEGDPLSEVAAALRELVQFKAIENLAYVHESVNKARRFHNGFKDRSIGIVDSHLYEISEEFPSAIFLVGEYPLVEDASSYQRVIRAGEVIRHTYNDTEDWSQLDIFVPYRDEYEHGLEFGSLWSEWLEEEVAAERGLSLGRDPKADAENDGFEWQWWQQPE
jgi:hypothetical protein